jgi:hypothetical protein
MDYRGSRRDTKTTSGEGEKGDFDAWYKKLGKILPRKPVRHQRIFKLGPKNDDFKTNRSVDYYK